MHIDDLEQELDDLLDDIHKIIDDEEEVPVISDEEMPDMSAFLGEEFVEEPAVSEPKSVQKKEEKHWTQKQKVPSYVKKLQEDPQQAYANWLYEQGQREAEKQEEQVVLEEIEVPKKRKHGFRNFVLVLLALAIAVLALVVFVLPEQPVAETGLSDRKEGVSTILLAGTDMGGLRTDTLMLLTVNASKKSLSLVSIPRDTLVNGTYAVPKINGVYAANSGGEEGIEMLMTRVSECIGFRPDGYMMIRLDAFVELVDALGGVTFDVPVDMYYNDPAQDLHIDLVAGTQTLTGEEAMGVVRFRSGYADADLGRVQVQRDFLSALIKQAVSVEGIAKSPLLLQILMEHTDSNLTASNYLWMAESLLLMDLSQIQTVTLPGTPRTISGGSYYVLDPESVAQTVNTYCNPYETEITASNLTIRSN